MFIKNSKFKALLKDAYKHHELNVGRTDKGVFIIDAPTWHLEAFEEYLTNEIKAMIVELVGDLPAAGQAWSYRETQEAPQTMMIDCLFENLWEQTKETKWIEMEKTRVYLEKDGGLCNMIQSKSLSKDNSYISVDFLNTIDKKACNEEEDMYGPLMNLAGKVLWYSSEMAFKCTCTAPRYSGERELLQATNGIDMNWAQTEAELI